MRVLREARLGALGEARRDVDAHYEDVKNVWDDRSETTHIRCEASPTTVVAPYLDCASPECG
jgi:hypothetical protein